MGKSRTLDRVERSGLCAGCGACAAVTHPGRVTIGVAEPGFLRPRVEVALDATEEQAIAAVCPGLTLEVDPGERKDTTLWGPYLEMRTGHATDPALRRQASSGGALSALLNRLLSAGAVDAVLQTGAAAAPAYANATVVSVSRDDVFEAAGSRYAPSAPLAEIAPLLDGERRYAFVGKPCDVAALRAMARRDPRVDRVFPYMLSFFCAGVPSLSGARAVVARLGVQESDLARFRYRGDGWPGFAKATRHDGSEESMSYTESWGDILTRHVQFRCKICPDGTGALADVVCADAWEADEKGYPVFEEGEGVSLIVSRTAKGEALVREAAEAAEIAIEPFDVAGLAAIQPGQFQRKSRVSARLLALAVLLRPTPRFRGLHLLAAARMGGIMENVKNFLGACRRVMKGQP